MQSSHSWSTPFPPQRQHDVPPLRPPSHRDFFFSSSRRRQALRWSLQQWLFFSFLSWLAALFFPFFSARLTTKAFLRNLWSWPRSSSFTRHLLRLPATLWCEFVLWLSRTSSPFSPLPGSPSGTWRASHAADHSFLPVHSMIVVSFFKSWRYGFLSLVGTGLRTFSSSFFI